MVLDRLGYPIASTVYLDAKDFTSTGLENIQIPPFPLIIKPIDEAHGNGVMMNINNKLELEQKLHQSFRAYPRLIIQRQITGKEFRVLVCKKSIILALFRHPPVIRGDGISTILSLIKKENSTHPLRGE